MAKAISDVEIMSGPGMRWSAEVEQHATLIDTRLVHCESASSIEPGQPLPTETTLGVQSAGKFIDLGPNRFGTRVDTFLLLEIGYNAATAIPGGVKIKCNFRSRYEFDGPRKFSEAQLKSFALWAAQMECWGYLRELVSSLTVRMGLPPYNIPSHTHFIVESLRRAGAIQDTPQPNAKKKAAGKARKQPKTKRQRQR